MKNIKICHICTNQGGGAGTAAIRLHKGLLKEGVDSHFLCVNSNKKVKNVHTVFPEPITRWERLLKRAHLYNNPVDAEYQKIYKCGGVYEMFSVPISRFRPEIHSSILGADVIHLHWIANFVNFPTFFRSIQKPIVWTFHDMNPFMGGFHYRGDLERNKDNSALLELEKRFIGIKKNTYAEQQDIHIVTPSNWLYKESKSSLLTNRFTHNHIPYGLDVEVFRKYPKDLARQVFNLPNDKKILLFVSDAVKNIRKGFELLVEAIGSIENNDEFIVVAVGAIESEINIPNLYTIGSIEDERSLALLYSAVDVFVMPSREDNFPNVVLEALACGTPVIGFSIGGLTDVIVNNFNGIFCDEVSSSSLRDAIEKFLRMPPFDENAIAENCRNKYNLQTQAQNYLRLYENILL